MTFEHVFRRIENFAPFKARVARLVRSNPPHTELRNAAEDLHNAFLARIGSFRESVRQYLNLCFTVDRVKVETIGVQATTRTSNIICQMVATILAGKARPSESEMQWLEDLREAAGTGTGLTNWAFPKLHILHNLIDSVMQTRAIVQSMHTAHLTNEVELLHSMRPGLNRELGAMMEELLALRRYGVKASFVQEPFAFIPGSAWVFWDPNDVRDTVHHSLEVNRYVALVALANKKDLTDLRLLQRNIQRGQYAQIEGFQMPFNVYFGWVMRRDGELDLASGILGGISVRDIFKEEGREVQFEAIRLLLSIRLYDLIVPLETVERMPGQVGNPRLARFTAIAQAINPLRKKIGDLLVPRMQELERLPQLVNQLEREVAQADEETMRRTMSRHEVINHIRKLPAGHRPSPAARQRALEDWDLTLADNETYVRKHHRGSGEQQITSHKQRVRRG